jgi:hypothetical protein
MSIPVIVRAARPQSRKDINGSEEERWTDKVKMGPDSVKLRFDMII